MQHISDEQPLYVWHEDAWLDTENMIDWEANVRTQEWLTTGMEIPFRVGTRFMFMGSWWEMTESGKVELKRQRPK